MVVHYHLRPGGIRRVIELAVPHLVRRAPKPVTEVRILTGEAADRGWTDHFVRQLAGVPVEIFVEPALGYLSEQRASPARTTAKIRAALGRAFADAPSAQTLVWAHNLGVGRNLILSRELASICAQRNLPLVSHHHDWWFDNRWLRWPEMRAAGFRTLADPAHAIFPRDGAVVHAAINQADAKVLSRHFGKRCVWLPNLTEPAPRSVPTRVRAARKWLRQQLKTPDAPIWVLPCRVLRRKNIAEALLLTRWLRPGGWLVVTASASSEGERPYFNALERAARKHRWPLRLGILAGNEAGQPALGDVLAASEAMLLTSVQEGFGLPYLEAAAARRPLIARRLPNIAPDLAQFGFQFPQAYDEILIAPELFRWRAERTRQEKKLWHWRATMPAAIRKLAAEPSWLAMRAATPIPFSRLTLTAQLEVLAWPAQQSWEACAPLNPFLPEWRERAEQQALQISPWPDAAHCWLGGAAYADRFYGALEAARKARPTFSPVEVQMDFIQDKLAPQNLYPLLWNSQT